MELEGTIIFDLPLVEGIGKNSGRPWKKKEWVLETGGMYPRKVKLQAFNDRVDMLNFEVGKAYAITIEIDSREFNGRWYTDVNALSARPIAGLSQGAAMAQPMGGQPMGQPMAQPASPFAGQPASPFGAQPAAPQPDPFAGGDNNTDDLPF